MLADGASLCTIYVVHFCESPWFVARSENSFSIKTLTKVTPRTCHSEGSKTVGTMPLITRVKLRLRVVVYAEGNR